jgi:hypothetical protein
MCGKWLTKSVARSHISSLVDKTLYMLNCTDYTDYTHSVQGQWLGQAVTSNIYTLTYRKKPQQITACKETCYPRVAVNVDGFWLRYLPSTRIS